MLRRFLVTGFFVCIAQFAIADIATDIASGVKVIPTTENAKNDNVGHEDAVVELIQAGVNCLVAIRAVREVYGLSSLETDGIITAAINTSQTCDTAQILALYSTGSGLGLAVGPSGTQGLGDVGSSGGGSVSPN